MNSRRRITGVVTSNKMQKTVVVEITRSYRHPVYKKVVHRSKRVKAFCG
jgi:small subunit ribosomal protein S17